MKHSYLSIKSISCVISYYPFMINEAIEKKGWVLTPGRYVGSEEIEDDGVSFEEKIKLLANELSVLFEKSNHLQSKIAQIIKDWQ